MSFSYSGDPSASQLDECRFLIQDTDPSNPILQDEEIDYIISLYGSSVNTLRYNLFMQAATKFARDIKRSLGPQSEDPTVRQNYYKEQMSFYKTQLATGSLPTVHYAYPKIFRKGMQSNPPWPAPGGSKYVR
jgi:hypothetical protein